jgi:serine/threonine protein kinase
MLHQVLHAPDALYLCIDFGGYENLFKLQCRSPQKTMALGDVQEILSQLSSALLHLHMHNFCHRDIKPENVTMDGRKAVLVDYGLADDADKLLDLCCGSLPFAAPEVMEDACRYYGKPVDAFALGVTVYEMVWGIDSFCNVLGWHGAELQSKKANSELADKVRSSIETGLRHPKHGHAEFNDAMELMDGLIRPNPNKRWNLEQVSQSMFLAAIGYEEGMRHTRLLGA